ncbi:hypothetical protein FNV43_RR01197 [Rhamnella rubrinervis]|uniref:Uncharacterized protein n=1 Tax=Rhamnella rubrinervis TaxID=2594499 RepID=A0A8K0MSM3_9ROSA|nr:hypothetical protein FNV43_RR01197 [Rhamnella rubrinervis]
MLASGSGRPGLLASPSWDILIRESKSSFPFPPLAHILSSGMVSILYMSFSQSDQPPASTFILVPPCPTASHFSSFRFKSTRSPRIVLNGLKASNSLPIDPLPCVAHCWRFSSGSHQLLHPGEELIYTLITIPGSPLVNEASLRLLDRVSSSCFRADAFCKLTLLTHGVTGEVTGNRLMLSRDIYMHGFTLSIKMGLQPYRPDGASHNGLPAWLKYGKVSKDLLRVNFPLEPPSPLTTFEPGEIVPAITTEPPPRPRRPEPSLLLTT